MAAAVTAQHNQYSYCRRRCVCVSSFIVGLGGVSCTIRIYKMVARYVSADCI